MKNKVIICILFFLTSSLYAHTISDLWQLTLENYPDVKVATHNYQSGVLSRKSSNGIYAPSVVLDASTNFSDDFEWKNGFDIFSSSIAVSEKLPGGLSTGIRGTFSYSATTIGDERYISQIPDIAFTLSQSLCPFWAQGKIKNPETLSLKLQEEYYYNQLLYSKKNVLQNVTQHYIMCQIYLRKKKLCELSIEYKEKQKQAMEQLKAIGGTDYSKIIELEQSIWSDKQSLAEIEVSYEQYALYLKNTCNVSKDLFFVDAENDENIEDFILKTPPEKIFDALGFSDDPYENAFKIKIQMQENNDVLRRQNSAPVVSMSVQPKWNLEAKKIDEWKDAWSDEKKLSWSVGVSVDLSPFISSAASKSKKKNQIETQKAEDEYNAYLNQKEFVKAQSKSLSDRFTKQAEEFERLYEETVGSEKDMEKAFAVGQISELDMDAVRMKAQSQKLNRECARLYAWLYEFLAVVNR